MSSGSVGNAGGGEEAVVSATGSGTGAKSSSSESFEGRLCFCLRKKLLNEDIEERSGMRGSRISTVARAM